MTLISNLAYPKVTRLYQPQAAATNTLAGGYQRCNGEMGDGGFRPSEKDSTHPTRTVTNILSGTYHRYNPDKQSGR